MDHIHFDDISHREVILLKVIRVLVGYFGSSDYSKELNIDEVLGQKTVYFQSDILIKEVNKENNEMFGSLIHTYSNYVEKLGLTED